MQGSRFSSLHGRGHGIVCQCSSAALPLMHVELWSPAPEDLDVNGPHRDCERILQLLSSKPQ